MVFGSVIKLEVIKVTESLFADKKMEVQKGVITYSLSS